MPLYLRLAAVLAPILACLPAVTRGEDVLVSGRVLGADGKPVMGAEVAVRWMRIDRRLEASEALVTNREGRFEGILRVPDDRPVAFMALDDPRQHGSILVLQRQALSAPIEIMMQPLVPIRAAFDASALGVRPELIRLDVLAQPGDLPLIATECKDDHFELELPPGAYALRSVADGAEPVLQPVVLPPGEGLTLEKLAFKPAPVNKAAFRPPPWTVTEARGLSREVKLDDLRGKWVLVEFWGFW